MDREEIIKTVTEAVIEAVERVVPPTVERVVNGKISKVQETLELHIETSREHWETTQTFMQNLQPVRDGLFTIQSLTKFIKWLGIPLAVIGAWLFNKF